MLVEWSDGVNWSPIMRSDRGIPFPWGKRGGEEDAQSWDFYGLGENEERGEGCSKDEIFMERLFLLQYNGENWSQKVAIVLGREKMRVERY